MPASTAKANAVACEKAGVTPYLAMSRERHHNCLDAKLRKEKLAPGEDASPADRMAHRLQTDDGSKTTFGILKSAIAGYESLVARTPTAYDLQFVFVAPDPAAALAPVARAAAELLAESRSRSRVRKCANPECVRHFVDE